MNRWTSRLACGAAVVALGAGCGYDDTPLPDKPDAESAPSTTGLTCTKEEADLASYDPGDSLPTGSKIDEIIERERLVVGVSADTYLMGSENPNNDNRIEGFDIEFAKAIGAAIFGDDFDVAKSLQYRVITAADRIPLLQSGEVDLVIRNFTINSCRWEEIAFSAEYYHATQKVLVNTALDDGDPDNGEYDTPESLNGLSVCAPTGSTSLDNIRAEAPDAIIATANTHTGCLVKFQQGEVDAITGDDTVLAGLAAQDPYAVVPEDQDSFSEEPYGIGANQEDVDLVRLVNFVLEDMRAGTGWEDAYDRWLARVLGKCDEIVCPPGAQGVPPTPIYGR